MEQQEENNRRPLAVRGLSITKRVAVWLSAKNITPNQISILSVAFSAVGLAFSVAYNYFPSSIWLLLIPVAIQMRLLCNLFDGMVAVEGGKKTPAGELFNDVPDRIADPLLILAAGFVGISQYSLPLAWTASLLAVLTAYIRVLGVSMGCDADFRGPMAKQHRMALLTVVLLIMFADQTFSLLPSPFIYLMDATLVLMIIGCIYTAWRRLRRVYELKAEQFNNDDH